MKFCEIGVYHHDCWFNDAIIRFPQLYVKEIGSRVYSQNSKNRVVTGLYRVLSSDSEEFMRFVHHISSEGRVIRVKPIDTKESKLLQVTWKASVTSYDAVLNSGCIVSSPCYSKEGLETYSVFAENPSTIKKLLYELEQIGEVNIFSMKNCLSKRSDKFALTIKQKQAIASAISMGYYSWPKTVNLEELAAKLGIKRRTLQENLRKAESKIIPKLIDELTH